MLRLGNYRSISARVRQRVDLYGQALVGAGNYHQGPPGSYLLRLEMRMQAGSTGALFQQVCDGKTMYQLRQVFDEPKVERYDIDRVLLAWESSQPGEALRPVAASLPLGGLPKMLSALAEWFEFTTVSRQQLSTMPVWAVRGVWKRERLLPLLERHKLSWREGRPPRVDRLPHPLPDEVVLWLGADDLFPYRIDYRRRYQDPTETPAPHGANMMILEFFEVRVNGPLEAHWFRFDPGSLKVADRTDELLARLKLEAPVE